MLLMWIGDQITERGIGNGISIIITVNIISALPGALVQAWQYFVTGDGASSFEVMMLVVMIALLLLVIAGNHRHHPGAAPDRDPVRQARGRPQTVRRPDPVSAAQGELRRRDADHLRLRGAVAAADPAPADLPGRAMVHAAHLRRARSVAPGITCSAAS